MFPFFPENKTKGKMPLTQRNTIHKILNAVINRPEKNFRNTSLSMARFATVL